MAMYPEAKLWMLKQYPQFSAEQMQSPLALLDQKMSKVSDDEVKDIVWSWVDALAFIHGERFLVNQIPVSFRPKIDVLAEAELIIGPGRALKI